MAAGRKLQAEVEKLLKKVEEGIEEFNNVWENVHRATHDNQREKFEAELKAQIKKLQRDREQIKIWQSDKSIKDKNGLAENRKKIEVEMERFKEFERDAKTKTYSKEGLSKHDKLDPHEEERGTHRAWMQHNIDKLHVQCDEIDADIEGTTKALGGGKKKSKDTDAAAIAHYKHIQETHRWHATKLEQLLRKLDNDEVPLEELQDLRDSVEFYVDENSRTQEDFQTWDTIYDGFDLAEVEDYLVKDTPKDRDEDGGASVASDVPEEKSGKGKEEPAKEPSKEPSKEAPTTKSKKAAAAEKAPTVRTRKNTAESAPDEDEKPVKETKEKATKDPVKPWPPIMSVWQNPLPAPQAEKAPAGAPPGPPGQVPPKPGSQQMPSSLPPAPERPPPPGQAPVLNVPPNQPPPKPAPMQPPTQAPPPMQPPVPSPPLGSPPAPGAPGGMPAPPPVPPPAPSDGGAVGPGPMDGPPSTAPPPPPPPLLPPPPPASSGSGGPPPSAPPPGAPPPGAPPPGAPPGVPPPTTPSAGIPAAKSRPAPMASEAQVPPPIEAPPPPTESPPPPPPERASPVGSAVAPEPSPAASLGTSPGAAFEQGGIVPASASSSMAPTSLATGEAGMPGSLSQARATQLLAASHRHVPLPSDGRRNRKYVPRNPYVHLDTHGHSAYPLQPTENYEDPAMFEKYDLDALFFIFYYQQGSYQQHLAAKELKKLSWRYHTKYLTWFQRHEEPRHTASDFERGAYVYFDHDSGWCQRIKSDFTFEYQFLEDEPM